MLPPFKPNQYLLEKFKDKGSNDHEIFAWATREAMSKFTGLKTCEADVKHKVMYKRFMAGKIDEMEMNGKTFTAEPMPNIFGVVKKAKKKDA